MGLVVAPVRGAAAGPLVDPYAVGGLEMPLRLGSGPATAAVSAVVALVAAVVGVVMLRLSTRHHDPAADEEPAEEHVS